MRLLRHGPPRAALAAGLLAALGASAPARADWVATWGAAPVNLPIPSLQTTTVRQYLRASVGGAQIRVRFSNETGARALTVSDAHLALPGSAPGSVDPTSDHPLTFGGAPSAVLPPGAPLLSDPVDLPVAPLTTLAVTAVLDGSSPQQVGHLMGGETAYLVPGDHAGEASLAGATTTQFRYALSGVESSNPNQTVPVIATLGDSITDGLGSTVDRDRRWTDRLAERLAARVGGPSVGVVNGGATGNTVASSVPVNSGGPSALARLDRDVLAQPGLRWLVLFEGINDIIYAPDPASAASGLIAAYGQIVARAHARGVRVIGATLTPFAGSGPGYYSAAKEAARQAVNAWIRTGSGGSFDAVVDFDAAVRDPSRPLALRQSYDSGDHLHPNDAGYAAMGDAVPLGLFR